MPNAKCGTNLSHSMRDPCPRITQSPVSVAQKEERG